MFSSSEILGDGVESKMVVLSGSADVETDDARFVLSAITDSRIFSM